MPLLLARSSPRKSRDHFQLLCPKIVKASTEVGQVASDDEENSNELPPVLLPAMFVRGVRGTYGTLRDNCSTDNYVVNDMPGNRS